LSAVDWPSIGIVVPTRNRPTLLRRALAGIDAQDYPGPLRTIVVYDGTEPEWLLARSGARPVMVLANWRAPGLAGARNTGILGLSSDLVAFCDDDDEWLPGKLTAQVAALRDDPADLATCAIEVAYQGRVTPRRAGGTHIDLTSLVRSRMAMLHASTFLIRRAALVDPDRLGLVAEDAPGSQNEDWDLLIRAARRVPVRHVDEPLVRVHWTGGSHFAYDYATKVSSLRWMMARHPEIGGCPPGAARVYGQLACWSAATGNSADAWRYARAALRNNWREPRAAIALAAASRMVRVESVLSALHKRGHGI
jgi:glycosyltransferase involved in cell wall biosynthesis